jgi:hypothetical protein
MSDEDAAKDNALEALENLGLPLPDGSYQFDRVLAKLGNKYHNTTADIEELPRSQDNTT